MKYLFKSSRLGFRNWNAEDLAPMTEINADPEVMEFFPKCPNKNETSEFIQRMSKQFDKNGFCYFAVDLLETQEFIGFIGISEQTYEAEFTPCVDIGWRISRNHWYKGYATEGAKACLEFAKKKTGLTEILSVAPVINTKSEAVMKKIGMQKVSTFLHSLLKDHPELQECVLYSIKI